MRLKHFFLIITLIVLIGLNIAGKGITSIVGDGPWQVTTLKLNNGHLTLGILGWDVTLTEPELLAWIEQTYKKISSLYFK